MGTTYGLKGLCGSQGWRQTGLISMVLVGLMGCPSGDDADRDGWPTPEDCDDGDPAKNLDDADGDGFDTCDDVPDCDDMDPTVHPLAGEVCDGMDNDCDGVPGEDEVDVDGDGVMVCADDCDDADPNSFPGAPEICDGADNDCNGVSGPGEDDQDGDGQLECADDCDDDDASRFLGAPEICDGIDNDCDGHPGVDEIDADGDGQMVCEGDCNDGDAGIWAGAAEACDGIDNDCSGFPDGDEVDADGDGQMICAGDCDDTEATVWLGAAELCDAVDNDCDGLAGADEHDDDGDGQMICEGDCDDTAADVFDGAVESCDGIDNDCDGSPGVDETDADGDGQMVCAGDCDDTDPLTYLGSTEQCDALDNDCDGAVDVDEVDVDADGFMICQGDCDDSDDASYPGASEQCDGEDNDCDGVLDAGEADDDTDGHMLCDGDCDDTDPSVFPGAVEACGAVDADCDGLTGCEDDDCAAEPDCLCRDTGNCCYSDTYVLTPPDDSVTLSISTSDASDGPRGTGYYYDELEFVAQAGQYVMLEITSAEFDTYIYLMDVTCGLLDEDDDGGVGYNSMLAFTVPETGVYTVVVTTYSQGSTGSCTLEMSNDTPIGDWCYTALDSIELDGGGLVGQLDGTDPMNGPRGPGYRFDDIEFVIENTANIDLVVESASFDTYLYLLDAWCGVIAEDDNSGGGDLARVTGELPAGVYTAVVTSATIGEQGTYNLGLLELPDVGEYCYSDILTLDLPDDVYSGSLSAGDSTDGPAGTGYYFDDIEFTAEANTPVIVEIVGGTFDSYIYLLDDSCQVVAEDDNGGNGTFSRLVYTPQTDGVLTVAVSTAQGGSQGSYDLHIEEAELDSGLVTTEEAFQGFYTEQTLEGTLSAELCTDCEFAFDIQYLTTVETGTCWFCYELDDGLHTMGYAPEYNYGGYGTYAFIFYLYGGTTWYFWYMIDTTNTNHDVAFYYDSYYYPYSVEQYGFWDF